MVKDLDHFLTQCLALGGKFLAPTRIDDSQGRFSIVLNLAGAVAAPYEAPTQSDEFD